MIRSRLIRLTSTLSIGLLAILLVSCDGMSDFGDMNEDPTAANDLNPDYEFTTLQLGVAGSRWETWRTNLIYAETIVQHLATTAGYWSGNFNAYNSGFSGSFWQARYAGGVNGSNFLRTIANAENLVARLEGEPQQVNRLAAARIMRVVTYQRMTDIYGDVPYFEAGKGFLEGEFTPHYTRQDSIYTDLRNELRTAVDEFDASQPTYGNADLFYGGDIEQWKRFANSLQLRLAMRQVKVNPQRAQNWAQEAIDADGGVMQSPDDDAAVTHQDGPSGGPSGFNTNANSETMTAFGDLPWLSETFVSWMQDRNDPRLAELGALIQNGSVITDPAQQRGLPPGYTANELANDPNYTDDTDQYTKVNPNVRDLDDPLFLQTYAEVELMLAEAEERWGIAPSSAAAHYEAGVEGAMTSLSKYGEDASVDPADVDQYLADNPYDPNNQEEALELINNQYWAATFLNGIEAWSNWRRSGYPDFAPAPEDGFTGGETIRRLAYPEDERDLNEDNYEEAQSRQNISQSNLLTARVWWDCGAYADQCND